MREKVSQRFAELIEEGKQVISKFVKDETGHLDLMESEDLSIFQAWISSVHNLIYVVAGKSNPLFELSNNYISQIVKGSGISPYIIRKMMGILQSAQKEWETGMLKEIEFIFAAETFDDFLDHAQLYHKSNKKIESSILASAVLEDLIKKISMKNSINPKGENLEPLINKIKNAGIFSPVKTKKVKTFAGIRNKAFHAEWDDFDIKDVGNMIKGIRELIEDFL